MQKNSIMPYANAPRTPPLPAPRATLLQRLFFLLPATVLTPLCLPSGPFSWLCFVLLVPFGLGVQGLRPYAGLLWGLGYGVCVWEAGTWWMHNAFAAMLQLPALSAWAMSLLFWCYQALPYAGLGWAAGWMHSRGRTAGPLFCACVFTLLTALRTLLCPGSLHQALAAWPRLIQAADFGGRHLLLFLLVLGNWLLVEALMHRHKPARAGACLAAFSLLVLGLAGYGSWRLEHWRVQEQQAPDTDYLRITALQPLIQPLIQPLSSATGHVSNAPLAAANELAMQTNQAAARFPASDLVLWPEIPRELPCDCQTFARAAIPQATRRSNAPILLACTEFKNNPEQKYNAAWTVGPDGACGLLYRKIQLVPFGEFMPLQNQLQRLGLRWGNAPNYLPGKKIRLLQLPGGKQVQPLICFESGFPGLVRRGVRQGADLLAVLSDDIWFASARAEAMHLDMTLLRAVEVRRPLVSCTNSGVSAHVRATGEIVPGTLARSGARTQTHARLFCPAVRTPYARFGDAWLWGAALWVLFQILRVRNRAQHRPDTRPGRIDSA